MTIRELILLGLFMGCAYESCGQENTGMRIPASIRDCYGNPDFYNRERRLPMTMTTFIQLLRKVELYKGAYFDLRTLSVSLLHRFRMDGIESIPDVIASPGVIPFRLTGHQFPKHKIVFQQLVPGNAYTFPNESLTAQELCTLHFMLSSTVEPWERGDEGEVCPYNLHGMLTGGSSTRHYKRILIRDPDYPKIRVLGAELSRCPIEDGVVHTSKCGTVSPGTVVAAIAAALEPQQVQIALLLAEPQEANDTDKLEKFDRYKSLSTSALLYNTWAATLAGDLAEVAVYQGPRIENDLYIGPTGEWNDTAIPRVYYMDQKNHGLWQMTDAEGRGGIDGIILAGAVKKWQDQMNRLRLSQVLEMYYSDRGVNFDTKYRACERMTRMKEITETSDLLQAQTMNFARVLSYTSPDAVQITDEKLEEFSSKAVQAYNSHLSNLLSGLHCDKPTFLPKVHFNVILDGTWTSDEATRVLAHLAEEVDVTHYGSSMSVINGEDGSWILKETHNPADLFKLQNNTDNSSSVTWPRSLKLELSLAKYSSYLAERVAEERRANIIGGSSHVILVLGYSATISDQDYSGSIQIISTFKQKNPDVRFVYLASEVNHYRFKELSVIDSQYTDIAIAAPDKSVETVVTKIKSSILTVPGRIMSAYCEDNKNIQDNRKEFEDYVTPGQAMKYRIHPQFLANKGVTYIKFQGSGYGDLTVCASRDEGTVGTNCTHLKDLEETSLNISSPCSGYPYQCPPLFLTVTVTRSLTRCAEDDCRYPDQVRFLLRHEGLRCVKDPDSENSSDTAHRSALSVSLFICLHVLVRWVTGRLT